MRLTAFGKYLACFVAVATLAYGVGSASFGTMIVSETFTHPDGNLDGQTPEIGGVWTNHSGTLNQTQVASGQAKLVQPTGSEDNHTNFLGGAIGAGTTVYSAFDLTVPTQTAAITANYFAHFKDAGNFFASRVYVRASSRRHRLPCGFQRQRRARHDLAGESGFRFDPSGRHLLQL